VPFAGGLPPASSTACAYFAGLAILFLCVDVIGSGTIAGHRRFNARYWLTMGVASTITALSTASIGD
jgi:hypothetical protein